MGAWSYCRGHKIGYDWKSQEWFYADNGENIKSEKRKCPRCGEKETDKGHDHCIADSPGVLFACCGHGINDPYKISA